MGLDDDKLRDGVMLNEAEQKLVREICEELGEVRRVMTIKEWLGGGDESDDWYDDCWTELAAKVGCPIREGGV